MKNLILIFSIICVAGCKNKLDDVTLTDNPYDNVYNGPKVVQITDVRNLTISLTSHPNKITITPSIQLYSGFSLYRNGGLFGTYSRTSHTSVLSEVVYDYNAVSGSTYTYTALLRYEDGITELSDPMVFTTP